MPDGFRQGPARAAEAAGSIEAPIDVLRDRLTLADWRRRIATLYAEVRELACDDPVRAWDHWRAVREALLRGHPQSPVPAAARSSFHGRYWPYDDRFRFVLPVLADPGGDADEDPGSQLGSNRFGRVEVPFPAGTRTLALYWLPGYADGLFLPFRDATGGAETYGAGRYLLDGAKGADLGDGQRGGAARPGEAGSDWLVLDFNFAYHPSCAFDPRWACPLAPPENRLDLRVEAGERLT